MRVRMGFNNSGLANGTGPSAEVVVTGNSNRDLRLFTGPPKGVK